MELPFIDSVRLQLQSLIQNKSVPKLETIVNESYSSLEYYYSDLEQCLLYEMIYQINRNIKYNLEKTKTFLSVKKKNRNIYVKMKNTDFSINDLIIIGNESINKNNVCHYAIVTNHTEINCNGHHKLCFLSDIPDTSQCIKFITCTNMTTFSRIYSTFKESNSNELHQKMITFNEDPPKKKSRIKPLKLNGKEYNESQCNAIKNVLSNLEGLHIIHGPPGTGKTYTLLGIIYNLFMKRKAKQILLTTTCNLTIAELTLKVLTLSGTINEEDVLVVGQLQYIDPRIHKYCIYTFVKMYTDLFDDIYKKIKLFNKQETKEEDIFDCFDTFDETIAEPLEDKQMLIDSWIQIIQNLPIIPFIKGKSCLYTLDKLLHSYTNDNELILKVLNKWSSHDFIMRQLLNKSKIILSTLSSSGSEMLRSYPFSTIIIDEAAQALQSETLIALRKETKTLVLIGDHLQREGFVQSTKTIKSGYSRSLMKRYIDLKYPMIMLNEQFRMHPEIASFPARYIYNNKLINSPGLVIKNQLDPYRLYNVFGEEQKDTYGSFYNVTEILRSLELITEILKKYNQEDIVIITPYQAQKGLFISELNDNNYKKIKVYTVDDYQGQESNVILFSTVRAGCEIGFLNELSRLNVSLTRAKDCFRIIGCFETLQKDIHWNELVGDAKKRNLFTS